jgi:hypothetical protein
MKGLSWIAGELLASQRLCSMELGSEWVYVPTFVKLVVWDDLFDIQHIIVVAVWNSAQFTGVKHY